jgi:hypothetical protein
MHDVPLILFMLAIVFILVAVSIDWALFRLGHTRGQPIRTDWPVGKQYLVKDLLFFKVVAQVLAGIFSILFVVITILALGRG